MKTIAEIAAEVQALDPDAMAVSEVHAFLERLAEPLTATEEVSLFNALGRVLGRAVISPISVPPHDNSAMDGYAFAGAQRAPGQALTLQIVGTALAGRPWAGRIGAGQCVKIMTGAVLPGGLDTVVPHELAQVQGEHIRIAADLALPVGAHRRCKGEDLMQGGVALARGEPLTAAALGLVASLGLERITAFRRLRVACFSTGDEILRPDEPPREGAVYDSNRMALIGMLTRMGVEVIDLGVVRDDPALLAEAFRDAARKADAIVTSGGVSAGDADHTRAMMAQLGDVAFWRVAMRPGRPMAVGRIRRDAGWNSQAKTALSAYPPSASSYQNDIKNAGEDDGDTAGGNALLFGLPGNPVAVMVSFLAFVRPALLRMMGHARPAPPLLRAVAATPLRKKPGRTEYQRGVAATAADGSLTVRSTGHQGSGMLSSMVQANCLIVLHHDQGDVPAGGAVDLLLLEGLI